MGKGDWIKFSIHINRRFFNGNRFCAAVIIEGQTDSGTFEMRINRVTKSDVLTEAVRSVFCDVMRESANGFLMKMS